MTRRELLAFAASAAVARAVPAPSAPVSIARCQSYDDDLVTTIGTMFDQIGGASRLVQNKTVTIKLNLTGSPALKFKGKPVGTTHYTHPRAVGAMVNVLGRAGAKRIRLVESAWASSGSLGEYMLDAGWNVRALQSAAPNVELVNTNAAGKHGKYVRFKVQGNAYVYPSYELHPAYDETDVFVSMAKLKNHATCGITLTMKNCFGITPASIYGDDAGIDEPNENPNSGRLNTCHFGKRQPSKIAAAEIDPHSSREPETRMPRISAELVSARPVHIAFIDGVQTVTGGEGPWISGLRAVEPHVLLLGTNPVTTDAVGAAVMGYDPKASRGFAPFAKCDNMLTLAEALGVGKADLKRIDVRGLPLEQARFPFRT